MDVDLAAVGARVRAARERAGLSQRGLQARTGISQPTLHRVEIGQRTNATLTDFDRLAQVLDIGLDELLYGSAVEARVLAAARTSGCSDDALRSALDQAIELLKLDDRLDAVVPFLRQEPACEPPEFPDGGSVREHGQIAAGQVREVLGVGNGPVADLVEAVEYLTGADVGTVPLPSGVSGVCATDPERSTSIILVSSTGVAERQRFTLAHELGHLLSGDKTHVDVVDGERSPLETLCDEFAGHLLIPEEGVRAWLSRVGPDVDERAMALLARYYRVSPEVTRIQMKRMGLLPAELRGSGTPTGRRWAYRYGWGPQFDSDQAAADQSRVPRRILDRAVEAYRQGKLGIGSLAKLQDQSVPQMEQALAEAGVVVSPAVLRADVSALVARAAEQKAPRSD